MQTYFYSTRIICCDFLEFKFQFKVKKKKIVTLVQSFQTQPTDFNIASTFSDSKPESNISKTQH